jgi:predicted Zn finger-like uncharacterized protein
MSLHVSCPNCRTAYKVPERHSGRVLRCKKCGERFRIEASTPVADNAAEAAEPSRGARSAGAEVRKAGARRSYLILGGIGIFLLGAAVTSLVIYFATRKPGAPPADQANAVTKSAGGRASAPTAPPDKQPKPQPAQSAVGWTDITSEDGRFAISFPGTPQKSSQEGPGGPVQSYVLALDGGNRTFTVTWNDLPGSDGLDPKLFLDSFAKEMAANAKEKKEVKANGHTGVELQMEQDLGGGPVAMMQRIYFVKGRLFQLIVTGAQDEQGPATVARFFDSFKPSDSPAVTQAGLPMPPIDTPKVPIDPPKPPTETPKAAVELPKPPDKAPKPAPVEVPQPAGPGSMRDKAIAWVKANNAFGPTHRIAQDVTNYFNKDMKENWGFSLMMDAGLLKSKKPTMLAGWNENFFVFEFPPEQAAGLKLAKNTMVFKGIAQDIVQRDNQPVTLSDLKIANAGALDSDARITGSVAYKTMGEVKGGVLMLRLCYAAGNATRIKSHVIGQTMPADSGRIAFSLYAADSADPGYHGPLVLFFEIYEHTGQARRRPVLSNTVAAVVVVTDPSYANLAPPPSKKVGLDKLEVKLPSGWKADYHKFLESWDFEKYTPAASGLNESSVLRVATVIDEPADVNAYAEKLKQKDYIDLEYAFTEITAKEKLPDGFLVKGVVSNYKNTKEKPRLGLAMIRTLGGVRVYCVSTSLRSEALRQEAIELFKSARLPTGQE